VDAQTKNRRTLTMTMPSDREIVFTRVFNAPRRLVFEAWTKPKHLMRWYGCSGSKLSVCEIDLRLGGTYRFVLQASDGNRYPTSGVYREIVPHERLVYTERFDGDLNREALITLALEERDGKTTMTSMARYQTAEDLNTMIKFGVEKGTGESLDRLAEHLETMV
jgi:uncharacterized protein YndB with AHSA1/START domain